MPHTLKEQLRSPDFRRREVFSRGKLFAPVRVLKKFVKVTIQNLDKLQNKIFFPIVIDSKNPIRDTIFPRF